MVVRRVLAESHDDHTAHDLALAIQLREASTQLRAQAHFGDVANQDRYAVGAHADRDVLDVLQRLEVPQSPNHVLGLSHLHETPADIVVASLYRPDDTRDRDVVAL